MFRHDRARTGCYGFEVPTGVDDEEGGGTPLASAIRSIYPNPFNPATRIVFDVSKPSRVNLSIYDVSGRKVCELVNEMKDPGVYGVVWNGKTVEGRTAASGIYFCRLAAGDALETRKIVLMR
jgi:hypothetical protein